MKRFSVVSGINWGIAPGWPNRGGFETLHILADFLASPFKG